MFRSENGHIYGPVNRSQLAEWASEGRVSGRCQLQLVGGDGRWESAANWIQPRQFSNVGEGVTQVDVATSLHDSTTFNAAMNEISSIGRARPHRGGLVLLIGLFGIGCPIFSAMAWALGYRDLAEMDAGRMDDSGRGLTATGMVLGILMIVLQTLMLFAIIMD